MACLRRIFALHSLGRLGTVESVQQGTQQLEIRTSLMLLRGTYRFCRPANSLNRLIAAVVGIETDAIAIRIF